MSPSPIGGSYKRHGFTIAGDSRGMYFGVLLDHEVLAVRRAERAIWFYRRLFGTD